LIHRRRHRCRLQFTLLVVPFRWPIRLVARVSDEEISKSRKRKSRKLARGAYLRASVVQPWEPFLLYYKCLRKLRVIVGDVAR